MSGKVAIVIGSRSDAELMKQAKDVLKELGVESEMMVMSAHRTPDFAIDFAKNADKNGFEVIIAGAGLAAHLPGVMAGVSSLPVIGVPIKSGALNGVDSLYAIVQMPPGVPVATVAIDGAKNAGILAAQMLAIKYADVKEALSKYKIEMAEKVNPGRIDI
ncbi:MAG: 5-(carboxyamino)imidazole ribonucleotide mutase [Armatimonadota bacterium]